MSTLRTVLLSPLLINFLIFAASGCSTTPVKWYKPATSQATFTRDKAECEEALLSTGTTQRTKDIYTLEGCLENKGYRAIPQSE